MLKLPFAEGEGLGGEALIYHLTKTKLMTTLHFCNEEISKKNNILAMVRNQLKLEFLGIDHVIDKVIDSMSNWFLFPQLQERPVIINLWGMTGVGKTALILRLAELLDFGKKLFRYDMGNNAKGHSSLKEILKELFKDYDGLPAMIMLDEFQYAKTKNENDWEIDNPFSRVVWDLLDSGKFQSMQHTVDLNELTKTKDCLEEALQNGVEVEKGMIVNNAEIFLEIMSHKPDEFCEIEFQHNLMVDGKETFQFVPKDLVTELYYCFSKKISILNFRKQLLKLDGPGTVELFVKAIEAGKANRWIDCSKTIIFVLGNLDEAYTMSSSFNPDINANEFHEASKLININHIKRALRKRFRNEQISRLGNNHIIFPSFNEATFYKLIDLELLRITKKYSDQFGINLHCSDRFKELIYQEGVFPTQGTRPLFSTIYKLVNTKIPLILSEKILQNLEADTVIFDYIEGAIKYEYHKNDQPLYSFTEEIQLNLTELRKPAMDDLQAITAVHEAGHAVISIAALKVIPEYICSTSADVLSGGMVVTKRKWKYFSKEEVSYRIAEYMGGIIAEKVIFGAGKVTRGAEQDIKEATELACEAVKSFGMGSIFATIDTASPNTNERFHDEDGTYNAEVKLLLEEGAKLAELLLTREKVLLLHLANYLSDERIMKKEMIEERVRAHGTDIIKNVVFVEDGSNLFYRNKLKQQLIAIDKIGVNALSDEGQITFALNKKQ